MTAINDDKNANFFDAWKKKLRASKAGTTHSWKLVSILRIMIVMMMMMMMIVMMMMRRRRIGMMMTVKMKMRKTKIL